MNGPVIIQQHFLITSVIPYGGTALRHSLFLPVPATKVRQINDKHYIILYTDIVYEKSQRKHRRKKYA